MKTSSDSIAYQQDHVWYMHSSAVALLLLVAMGIAFGSYTSCLGFANGY